MTDRIYALTVALESDVREDDAQDIIIAIMMIRGVLSVTPHEVTPNTWATREQVRQELIGKLWQALKPQGGNDV